jgi:AraC-like DNA-binding protein
MERNEIPADQTLILPFAEPHLQTWGDDSENYILQQFCEGTGVELALVTIRVSQCSIIRVQFKRSMNEMLYTLQGFAFAKLKGHGCLPLFENTYTLQYIPKGEYEVLFAPGTYHFLYLIPGKHLKNLSPEYPGIAKLVKSLREMHSDSLLGARLPMNQRVKNLIGSVLDLPAGNGGRRFDLTAIALDLLREFHRQLGQEGSVHQKEDLTAAVYSFIASHIEQPVGEIIRAIKKQFFIEAPTLRNHWLDRSKTGAPRKEFKELRLILGLYLLTVEGYSVGGTADRLSFKNRSNFSYLFHERFGVPPVQAGDLVDR